MEVQRNLDLFGVTRQLQCGGTLKMQEKVKSQTVRGLDSEHDPNSEKCFNFDL